MHPKQAEAIKRRKMEERIADEVMGLFVVKEGCPETVLPGMVLTTGVWKRYFLANLKNVNPRLLESLRLKRYSVSPDAAWEVVERMKSLGFAYQIESKEEKVTVRFIKGDEVYEATSEGMPKSVCMAALEAISGYKYE
ncbi:BC1872 family protein [Laceyella putida]|uniref:Phage ABA sandwich domain-containing protein n=1 Tax=Laceyella putida TaxID=110101 RepID=A0ABW2RRF6_9BACL